jgi:hypothetical protein
MTATATKPTYLLTREEMIQEVLELEISNPQSSRLRDICYIYGTKFGPISKDLP